MLFYNLQVGAHELMHLLYGVFDENPTGDSDATCPALLEGK